MKLFTFVHSYFNIQNLQNYPLEVELNTVRISSSSWSGQRGDRYA
ncbi:MAG: hypothetical protein AB1861_12500 [Cyanobacteriota bacterium]